jgi:hypothetical protein
MHGPINVKSPNNTSKWQMEFNSAFKGLRKEEWLFRLVSTVCKYCSVIYSSEHGTELPSPI